MKKLIPALGLAAVLALGLTGCSQWNQAQGRGDAPVDHSKVDNSPAEVINFPDTFGNVADKCDGHGHRVYTNTHGTEQSTTSSFIVVVADQTCPGGTVAK